MIYIESPADARGVPGYKSLFLAGGITSCPDWQKAMTDLLLEEKLVIFNPRRKNFPISDPGAARKQIEWEYIHLKCADMILFWFSAGSLNPIVLYELGKWGTSSNQRIFVGIDPSYERINDVIIQTELARPEVKIVFSLDELSEQVKRAAEDG